jgi:hypothetical protein
MTSTVYVIAAASAALGLVAFAGGLRAALRRRPLASLSWIASALLALAVGALFATLAVATLGYQTLVREETAAWISVTPTGPQRFEARVRLPDGKERTFQLAGDEVYVDAHILKWKPIANLLGLHTAYELSRIAGRYAALEQERTAPRTVHSLAEDKPVDLFLLRRRYALLAPLVDAEYGSATFVTVSRPAEFEIKVSASGLLVREAPPASR